MKIIYIPFNVFVIDIFVRLLSCVLTAPMKVGSAQKLSVDVIDVDEEEEVLPVRQQVIQ